MTIYFRRYSHTKALNEMQRLRVLTSIFSRVWPLPAVSKEANELKQYHNDFIF